MATTTQILVVDDEPQVRSLTCNALRRLGVQCQEAGDGFEAYVKAKETQFDGVLADLRMPNRHGFALCNDLLKMPSPPKLMVMTGVRDDRIAFDLINRGVKRIFHKPVEYSQLAQDILATVDNDRTQKEKKTVSQVLKEIEQTLCETTEIYRDKLSPLFDDVSNLSLPPKSARDFIARLAKAEGDLDRVSTPQTGSAVRRRKQRAPCFTVATAVETDANWRPLGEPFKLSVRDVSEGGMRLLHTRSASSKYLAISWYATQLTAEEIQMPCRITRCKPYLTFYEIGLQFVLAD